MRHRAIAGAGLAAALVLSTPASSHHSFAMFDRTREVTLTGTVKAFEWTNPHSWLQLEAPYRQGIAEWSIEMGSPNTMVRQGWRRTSFKPGDTVTVTIWPMRDGSHGGAFVSAKGDGGKVLP